MTSESTFRWVTVAEFALTMLVVGYRRIQAAKSGEPISRRAEEPPLLFAALSIAALCMWTGAIAYMLNPAWMQWASMPLADWVRWAGAAAGFLSILLLYWTLSNLGKNLTHTVATRTAATLVTTGPYRWVRHPFYVAVALLMAGVSVLAANWFIGVSGVVVMASLIYRTTQEEQRLLDKFGDEYRAYMAATGRFWPRRSSP